MKTGLTQKKFFAPAIYTLAGFSVILPVILAFVITQLASPTAQHYLLLKSFSLLLLGLFLSVLATLNFSLSFATGLLCAPLSFVTRIPATDTQRTAVKRPLAVLALMNLLSPPVVILIACAVKNVSVTALLTELAFGWDVWGVWTPVVVWCVWWPAWLAGGLLVAASLFASK